MGVTFSLALPPEIPRPPGDQHFVDPAYRLRKTAEITTAQKVPFRGYWQPFVNGRCQGHRPPWRQSGMSPVLSRRQTSMLIMATVLAGTFHWNDQLSYGVTLPSGFPYCTGVADAPDRGVYVLLRSGESCPDLNQESLFEYVERKKISSIAIIAWYNNVEEFKDVSELARAYCPKRGFIHQKRTIYGDVHYCFVSKGRNRFLRSFVQLHTNDPEMAAVNIEFNLINSKGKYMREYWRMVESLLPIRPSAD